MASSSAAEGKKKIVLKSSDGKVFELEEAVAKQSATIDFMIELGCEVNIVPLVKINSNIFTKVVEYMDKHAATTVGEDLNAWDADYIENMDQNTLFSVILAADFLVIKNLLNLCCRAVANMLRGKSVEEIRQMFGIENDFGPEEEEEEEEEEEVSSVTEG